VGRGGGGAGVFVYVALQLDHSWNTNESVGRDTTRRRGVCEGDRQQRKELHGMVLHCLWLLGGCSLMVADNSSKTIMGCCHTWQPCVECRRTHRSV